MTRQKKERIKVDTFQESPDLVEKECIALAYKQAKEMLEAGTAPPSIVTHFLQRGSGEQQLKDRKNEATIEVMEAKADSLNDSKGASRKFEEAIAAMKSYDYDPLS